MKKCITNANIWSEGERFDWMTFEGGKIIELGNGDPNFDGNPIDLGGSFVYPGLIESHIHVYGIGLQKLRLQLNKPSSISEMQNRLKQYADTNPTLTWIVGYNWDQDYMEDDRYPSKEDIDLIINDRPVVLYRGCNHILLLNSKALELAGITSDTQNPSGGQVDKDNEGKPTGILREKAMSLFSSSVDLVDDSLRKKAIKLGLQECVENGITSVQTNDRGAWEIYNELALSNALPLRVSLTMYHDEIEDENGRPPGSTSEMFFWDRIKIVGDGSLGAQTAALREPYSDTGEKGLPIYSQEELIEMITMATSKGYRIETHAIGDLAAEYVLNAYETVEIKERPILTHCQVLGRDLIERMKNIGVIANVQPQFVKTDSQWVEKRLGKENERLDFAYAWKTLMENNIIVAGGSDAPIEPPTPLDGIFQAIFRYNPKNEPWKPEEGLTFEEALKIYTVNGAYAMMTEDKLGILKPGYLADFIVINRDISTNPKLIPETKIQQVWVNGSEVYRNSLTNA